MEVKLVQAFKKLPMYFRRIRIYQRLNYGLTRAAATNSVRNIVPSRPATWEFSGFSQNGEDGIIDYLCSQLKRPNRSFVEIGSSDGFENNTAWLAIAKRYAGVMIEGNSKASNASKDLMSLTCPGVQCVNSFVTRENVLDVLSCSHTRTPDVFSLDIDGMDYHIATFILTAGIHPKIWVVEYNSTFGPDRKCTIPYRPDFNYNTAHSSLLYYGASIQAWRDLMVHNGYQFVTADQNGVNAFFVDPKECALSANLESTHFVENVYQLRKFKKPWHEQISLIRGMELIDL